MIINSSEGFVSVPVRLGLDTLIYKKKIESFIKYFLFYTLVSFQTKVG